MWEDALEQFVDSIEHIPDVSMAIKGDLILCLYLFVKVKKKVFPHGPLGMTLIISYLIIFFKQTAAAIERLTFYRV